MKFMLPWLLVLLVLSGGPAAGQARPPGPPRPAALADSLAEVARADTAVAVQRLFASGRRNGRGQLLLNGVLAGIFAYNLLDARPETPYQRISTAAFGLVVGYYTWPLLDWPLRQYRYRRARETRVLDRLDQGRPLPRGLRRRLKPAYFGVKVEEGH